MSKINIKLEKKELIPHKAKAKASLDSNKC
jgi:hypothetical protein